MVVAYLEDYCTQNDVGGSTSTAKSATTEKCGSNSQRFYFCFLLLLVPLAVGVFFIWRMNRRKPTIATSPGGGKN